MRHATEGDLKDMHNLLEKVRAIPGVKEKQFGHFYYKGKNVLHFHEDAGRIYADVGEQRIQVVEGSYDKIMSSLLHLLNFSDC